MDSAALARPQNASEIVRVLYPVENYYKRRLAFALGDGENVVYIAVLIVRAVADTTLMRRALRRTVERLAVAKPDGRACALGELLYLGDPTVGRPARKQLYADKPAAVFQPFENGVFAENLNVGPLYVFAF